MTVEKLIAELECLRKLGLGNETVLLEESTDIKHQSATEAGFLTVEINDESEPVVVLRGC